MFPHRHFKAFFSFCVCILGILFGFPVFLKQKMVAGARGHAPPRGCPCGGVTWGMPHTRDVRPGTRGRSRSRGMPGSRGTRHLALPGVGVQGCPTPPPLGVVVHPTPDYYLYEKSARWSVALCAVYDRSGDSLSLLTVSLGGAHQVCKNGPPELRELECWPLGSTQGARRASSDRTTPRAGLWRRRNEEREAGRARTVAW